MDIWSLPRGRKIVRKYDSSEKAIQIRDKLYSLAGLLEKVDTMGMVEPEKSLYEPVDDFPIISRVLSKSTPDYVRDPTVAYSLRPADVDNLVREISEILQICSVTEAYDTAHKRSTNTTVMRVIGFGILNHLVVSAYPLSFERGSPASLPLMTLICRGITSRTSNLEALLRMMDADLVPDYANSCPVRCDASQILCLLLGYVGGSLWSTKLSDGARLAPLFIDACSKSLVDDYNAEMDVKHSEISPDAKHLNPLCSCHELRFAQLALALQQIKQDPYAILQRIYSLDWESVFVGANHTNVALCSSRSVGGSELMLFSKLYRLTLPILQDGEDKNECRVLLQKLGSCTDLLHRALAQMHVWDTRIPSSVDEGDVMEICDFIGTYMRCLTPVPIDSTTLGLLRKANKAICSIKELFAAKLLARCNSMMGSTMDSFVRAQGTSVQQQGDLKYNLACKSTTEENWLKQHERTYEQHWEEYNTFWFSQGSINFKKFTKSSSQMLRRDLRDHLETQKEMEMCANCYTTESDVGKKLFRCSRCKQAAYCCKACQVEHWRKIHKQQCNK